MRVGDQDILIPASMVGNYPNPRWWDAGPVRDWTGDQEPPDSFRQEAFQDAMAALVSDQEHAGPGHHHRRPAARRQLRRPGRLLLLPPAGLRPKGGYLGSRSTAGCMPAPRTRRSSGTARSWWSRRGR